MLKYKGYIGYVEFDDKAEIFHGEVINTRDVITFQGNTIAVIASEAKQPRFFNAASEFHELF